MLYRHVESPSRTVSAPHTSPRLKSRLVQERLEWVMRPPNGMRWGEVFVDGSRLYAEHDLFGL